LSWVRGRREEGGERQKMRGEKWLQRKGEEES
jgi:hypothetical protein